MTTYKKTYIPGKPRNKKLTNVTSGAAGVGKTEFNQVAGDSHTHPNKGVLDQITEAMLASASRDMITSTDTETELTDENYLSSLRVIAEILKNNETIKDLFLSKVDPDTAQEIIKFVKGIEIGTFTTGPLGAGASLKMENGVSRLEVDNLDVRMRATFRELIIESLKHIGGQLILSPARMKCTSVVDGGTYYRCYFDTGDGKVSNEFVAGDQARCQVFTGSGVKMYWRLVTSVGTDWINISKTDAISGSSIPEAGDDIVQLGNRTDTTRQNAQILSTVGSDAPSWKQYKGINAFSLEGKDTTVFSGTGNKIDGKTVFMSSGANVEDGINSKNSNYSSQPTSYKSNDTWTLSADQTVNGIAYKSGEILTATQDSTTFVQSHWVKKVRYTDDTAVNNLQIGGVNLIDGTSDEWQSVSRPSSSYYFDVFYPNTELVAGQTYTFSWEAELVSGANDMYINIGAGATNFERNIVGALNSTTHAFNRRSITFTPTEYQLALGNRFAFRWYNNLQAVSFRYRKLKLEKGNKPTDWTPAVEDVKIDINKAQTDAEVAKLTAEQAKLAADGYMRARFIRDWVNGNNADIHNRWIEIKVASKSGVNYALGKTPTSNLSPFHASYPITNITDGDINTTAVFINSGSAQLQYVQIDLGAIKYDIESIQVWHSTANSVYLNTKTEISVDGVNWTPVFDSAKSGTYKETAAGNIISFRPNEVLAKVLKGAAVTDTFKTTINGGLISTVITEYRELNSEQVTGLISGIQGANKNLPFLVAGGTYAEGIAGTAKAIIRHDGTSKFTDAEVEGKVTAEEGKIGDMSIINGALTSNYSYFTYIGAVYVQVTVIMNLSQSGLTLTSSYGGTTDHPQVITWTCEIGHTSINVGSMEMRRDGIYRDGTKIL